MESCGGLQANPPELDQVEDLASLVSINESSVLHTLLQRHRARLPHTCSGPDLIVLQPRGPTSPSAGKVRWGTGDGRGWVGVAGKGLCRWRGVGATRSSGGGNPEHHQPFIRLCFKHLCV